jgi:hypothetical protein
MPAFMDNPSDTATWAGPGGLLPCTPAGRLELAVVHPALGVCVVTVTGELDILTALLPDACVGEELVAAPRHLVLDLEPVRASRLAMDDVDSPKAADLIATARRGGGRTCDGTGRHRIQGR